MVIDPAQLESEIGALESRGLMRGELIISERAHVLLPFHVVEEAEDDRIRSRAAPELALDTTRRGIGPAYADRSARFGVRFAEFVRPERFGQRLSLLYARKSHLPDLPPLASVQATLDEVAGRLRPRVRSTEPILWEAVGRGDEILLEGAQSALLDLDFGTYPYVTSSHPTSAGTLVGSGIPPQELDRAIGVAKAYATRVGAGPFPTEVGGDMGAFLQRVGHERGATTGRSRRCGWLDLVLLRYAARLNGFNALAVTKVDVLGGLDEVPVCVRYIGEGGAEFVDFPPTVPEELSTVEPVYQSFPGWPEFNERLRERIAREGARALPSTLRRFLEFVAREIRVPVEYISYGPHRAETVEMSVAGVAGVDPLPAWVG